MLQCNATQSEIISDRTEWEKLSQKKEKKIKRIYILYQVSEYFLLLLLYTSASYDNKNYTTMKH